jgi:hypothetical protein
MLVPATQRLAQSISLSLQNCLHNGDKCTYPIPSGATFQISATSDSGLPVIQSVVSGPAIPGGGTGTVQYTASGSGTVVIRGRVASNAVYDAAPTVDLVISISDSSDAACPTLGPASPSQITEKIDLSGIVTLLGSPTPFVLSAQGDNRIFVYSTRLPLQPNEQTVLATIPGSIAALVGQNAASLGIPVAAKAFSVELNIPHAASLGDPAARINALNYSTFTVQDIGNDRVKISATSAPSCAAWTAFLSAVKHLVWQATPEPSELKLFYLSSTDAAAAFTALGTGAPVTTPVASPTAAPSSGGSSAASTAATVSVNQPPGSVLEIHSDTTPCVIAGLTLSNSSGCAPASSGTSSGGSSAAAAAGVTPKQPIAMAAMNVAQGTGEQTPSDLLVFSDQNPGDDAQITERKRILAMLDLPRPEMVINAWVMQDSTVNSHTMGAFAKHIRDLVTDYNLAIEEVVLDGWRFVRGKTQTAGYFSPSFYNYISGRFVSAPKAPAPNNTQDAAQTFLTYSQSTLQDKPEALTATYGICPADQYCLGFSDLFEPLKPRLPDFLLTLIAAADPLGTAGEAIGAVEGAKFAVRTETACDTAIPGRVEETQERRERCHAVWNGLDLTDTLSSSNNEMDVTGNCAVQDYREILGSVMLTNNGDSARRNPRLYLNCFRAASIRHMPHVGLLRAALADFLFQYKMSQQYPHEFSPYDLSHSADALNAALNPLIDGFNQDVVAFQTFMRADVEYQVSRINNRSDERCCLKRLFGADKPFFFNDGLVTVRTISGQLSTVSTTSQSSLNNNSAPALSALLSGLGTPGTTSTGTSPLSAVAAAQPAIGLLGAAANAYQSSSVQIGRSLNLSVTPRSLSTASSAEIAVTLNVDESTGGAPIYTGPSPSQNTSRVANHDITTRVRVESVKLFEVSSFSAILERSRSKIPLIPPFVEIPYIGAIAGLPVPGAREYHASTAILSAMVVPTAADLAYGLRFSFDWVLAGDQSGTCSFVTGSVADAKNVCRFRRAVSMHDLIDAPIREFHKSMINCFATDMETPFASSKGLTGGNVGACLKLTFRDIPAEGN